METRGLRRGSGGGSGECAREDTEASGRPDSPPRWNRCQAGLFYALQRRSGQMGLTTILLIVLVLLLVGALPSWPYSRSWGYAPSGLLTLVVIVVVLLVVSGRL